MHKGVIINMIIIAIDSFKGSLSSIKACQIVKNAIIDVTDKIIMIPIGDGGEGTGEAFRIALGGTWKYQEVTGPNWQKKRAGFVILPDGVGVIEMAQASGIMLAEDLNPMNKTTFGTGELIRAALDAGCKRLILGIGGSATNDGGVGMAAALGAKFYKKSGEEIKLTGGGLAELYSMNLHDMDPRLRTTEIIVACDVTNPFYGPDGASVIYGPQKGADSANVEILDNNLKQFAEIIQIETGIDLQNIPGSGAGGGLGGGLVAFTGGKLRSGIELLLEIVSFEEKIKNAEMVITGEGSFDQQSLSGKVVSGIAKLAKKVNIPVIVFAGAVLVEKETYQRMGITAAFSTNNKPISLEEAKRDIEVNLFELAGNVSALWQLKKNNTNNYC